MQDRKDILIIGLGNPILGDDAIGIDLAAHIGKKLNKIADTMLLSISGIGLLDYICDYKTLVVIDSIKTGQYAPGHLFQLTMADLGKPRTAFHTHGIGFKTALEFGEVTGYNIPSDIRLFAIEAENTTDFSEELTDKLKQSFASLTLAIEKEIRKQPI